MGKTRLLIEFRRRLPDSQVIYYAGQCLSYGGAIPYHPVRDILQQVCGVPEGDEAAASVAAVRRRLQDMGIVAAEDVALVLQILDLPVAPASLASFHIQVRKAQTFALLRQLMFHTAQQHPLVLAVENLHWYDAIAEEWLASLVERLPGARLLLVVTYRPGYQPPWGTYSAATQLALPPLRPQDSWAVVQAILHRAPPADECSHLSRWNSSVKISRLSKARYLTWSCSCDRSAEHTDQYVRAPHPQGGRSRE
jgi:predicted ATPase